MKTKRIGEQSNAIQKFRQTLRKLPTQERNCIINTVWGSTAWRALKLEVRINSWEWRRRLKSPIFCRHLSGQSCIFPTDRNQFQRWCIVEKERERKKKREREGGGRERGRHCGIKVEKVNIQWMMKCLHQWSSWWEVNFSNEAFLGCEFQRSTVSKLT